MIKDKGALDPIERQATVLFIDLTGFTKLTEAKGPRAIVDILNAYFDAATEIIGKHNGVVTQFQGDAILAIFNVPFEDEDHAQHAFDAATDLLDTVRNETFAGEQLAIRIGLNSGPLIAGNVGGGGRQSYTVHGDAVNLAARLEKPEQGPRHIPSRFTIDGGNAEERPPSKDRRNRDPQIERTHRPIYPDTGTGRPTSGDKS